MTRGRMLSLDLFGDCLNISQFVERGESTERRRLIHALNEALRSELTERQRDCIRLRYYEGRSVTEVADSLGISVSVASRHLRKARERLGSVLEYVLL